VHYSHKDPITSEKMNKFEQNSSCLLKTLSTVILPAVLLFLSACISSQKQYYDSGKIKKIHIVRSFSLRMCSDCGKRYTHIEKTYYENGKRRTLNKTRMRSYYASQITYQRKREWDESGKRIK
jgi:hypothetical protein